MLRRMQIAVLPCQAPNVLLRAPLFPDLYMPPVLLQGVQSGEALLLKYDLQIETKTEGVVDEMNPPIWKPGRLQRRTGNPHTSKRAEIEGIR